MGLFQELRRRHVIRYSLAYLVAAWAITEVAAFMTDTFGMPESVLRAIAILMAAGLPVAAFVGWRYRITGDGLVRFDDVPDASEKRRSDTIRSVAVLPLMSLGVDGAEEQFFTDGMTDALIEGLSRISELRVISRTSVMQFRGTVLPLSEIGRNLGVDAVMEGSVSRDDERVRISVRLRRTVDEAQIWGDRFDRPFRDVLELQDQVAEAVADRLRISLGGKAKRTAVDREAFLLTLRGRHHWNRRTQEDALLARQEFERALDLDPTFVPALVGLADTYCMLANYGYDSSEILRPAASRALERAAEVEPDDADVHRVRALILWQFEFDFVGAVNEYECALARDPNSALAMYWYGICLCAAGDLSAGRNRMAAASELDPLSLIVTCMRGWSYSMAKEFDDAHLYFDSVLKMDDSFFPVHWLRGEAFAIEGRYDEAIESLEHARILSGNIARMNAFLGFALARAGRTDDAKQSLKHLRDIAKSGYVSPYFEALVLMGLKDQNGALTALERSAAIGDTMLRDLKISPIWEELHDEPRYQAILESWKLPT